jgi:hypothetical protein
VWLTDANGVKVAQLLETNDTPRGIADIISEPKLHASGIAIVWAVNQPRKLICDGGKTLTLSMTPNHLGWVSIMPITDKGVIAKLLAARAATALIALPAISPEPPLPSMPVPPEYLTADTDATGSPAMYYDPVATLSVNGILDLIKQNVTRYGINSPFQVLPFAKICLPATPTADTARSGVSIGKAPALTGVEILQHAHIFLGHAPYTDVIATLQSTNGLRYNVVTKQDIDTVILIGCGICESAKMRRRAFKSSEIKDLTPPPVGKIWTFDSLALRVPSAEFANAHTCISRFVNKLLGVPGKRRSYGHKTMTAEDIEKVIQKLRAFVRPVHGEILVLKGDSHPTHKSKHIDDYCDDSGIQKKLSRHTCTKALERQRLHSSGMCPPPIAFCCNPIAMSATLNRHSTMLSALETVCASTMGNLAT